MENLKPVVTSLYRTVFPRRHVILPVIHVASTRQALDNTHLAREIGCDGVFLINHDISPDELLAVYCAVRTHFRDWWVGVNCLGLAPSDVFARISGDINGVWADNAGVDERTQEQTKAEAVLRARSASRWRGLYFGGVAFKYQRLVRDLASAARVASRYMDVVTTSGPGTGEAARVDKIRAMKQALGDFPLAIASGITPENLHDYLDIADCFLVATGVSRDFHHLDRHLLKSLVDCANASCAGRTSSVSRPARPIQSVCFVCEWNEGRSVHIELSTRRELKALGSTVQVSSAGLSQGEGISELRQRFLAKRGIPEKEIKRHQPDVFGPSQARASLVLVAELYMKHKILQQWPELTGRVRTARGFLSGIPLEDEDRHEQETHIEDADGHNLEEKLALYQDLEDIAKKLAPMLKALESNDSAFNP